jgi:hypothetical protein
MIVAYRLAGTMPPRVRNQILNWRGEIQLPVWLTFAGPDRQRPCGYCAAEEPNEFPLQQKRRANVRFGS